MAKLRKYYKCEICSNIVYVNNSGAGDLVCCGENMKELIENNDESVNIEKHIPFVVEKDNKIKIQIGEIIHPKEEKHYIQFVSIETKNKVFTKFIKPNEEPVFELDCKIENIDKILSYCNIHGLWVKKF